jgi:hypothetical protein
MKRLSRPGGSRAALSNSEPSPLLLGLMPQGVAAQELQATRYRAQVGNDVDALGAEDGAAPAAPARAARAARPQARSRHVPRRNGFSGSNPRRHAGLQAAAATWPARPARPVQRGPTGVALVSPVAVSTATAVPVSPMKTARHLDIGLQAPARQGEHSISGDASAHRQAEVRARASGPGSCTAAAAPADAGGEISTRAGSAGSSRRRRLVEFHRSPCRLEPFDLGARRQHQPMPQHRHRQALTSSGMT